jgi:hypothetical protein
MKTNARIFLLLTVFYIVDAAAYGVWSYLVDGKVEIIGTAAIAMLVFLSGFIAFYIYKTARTQGPVPEDNLLGKVEEADGEIGFFSPWSWWPFALGAFAAITFASLAVGWWLFFFGLPLSLIAVVGFVFEYSRGQHAH